MARIRTIKPEFWTDSLMVQLPVLTRLLYIALWNAADDHGFLPDEPERLAMQLMPRECPLDVDAAIELLVVCGRLERFASDVGETYLRIARWESHQKVDHPAKSRIAREGSRKLAIPHAARRALAEKYGCAPGGECEAACFYCGAEGRIWWPKRGDGRASGWVTFPGLEIDHVEPESQGVAAQGDNLVLACRSCNRSKGARDVASWLNERHAREDSRGLASSRGRKGKGIMDQGGAAAAAPRACAREGDDDGGMIADVRQAIAGVPHAEAVEGALRAAQHPVALAGELLAMTRGMRGPAVEWDVLCRAVHELHVAGSRVTAASLRAFTRRLLEPEPERGSGTGEASAAEWDALIERMNQIPDEQVSA